MQPHGASWIFYTDKNPLLHPAQLPYLPTAHGMLLLSAVLETKGGFAVQSQANENLSSSEPMSNHHILQ